VQVMLALQNNAPAQLELEGLSASVEPVAGASAKFDLSVSLAEERTADGSAGGLSGVMEYASDLFDRGSVEALAGRLVRLLEAAGAAPDVAVGRLGVLSGAERRTLLQGWAAAGRARAGATPARPVAAAAGGVCGAGGGDAGCGCGCVCGRRAQLWGAGCARQPACASSARARGGRGERGGGVPGALAGAGGCAPRHPQGRRRLSAARPRI